jgi:hypothetical protein
MFQNSNVPEFNRVFDRSHLSQSKNSKKHIEKITKSLWFRFSIEKEPYNFKSPRHANRIEVSS